MAYSRLSKFVGIVFALLVMKGTESVNGSKNDGVPTPDTRRRHDNSLLLQPKAKNKTKKETLDVCVLVEPSPLTYMSGYANRFLHLFDYLAQQQGDTVRIITTEVVAPNPPTTHLGSIPVLYTRGCRLPHYPIMSISFDWTLLVPRTLLRHRPDLMHVTTPGLYVFGTMLWARLFQIPLVVSYHTHLPVYVRSYFHPWIAAIAEPLVWFLLKVIHATADMTVVPSAALQQEFHQRGIHGVSLWPKGVDTIRFDPRYASVVSRKRLLLQPSEQQQQQQQEGSQDVITINTNDGNDNDSCILLLYVGRLALEKRLQDLLAIMDQLPAHYRLALVGKGPQEQELRALFADHCNNGRVTFVGPLYDEDLQAAYASADIFIIPSDSETLGFVVMEAMASGLPVVAANAGGIPDMVQDGETGYLVSAGDIVAYLKAITSLGDNQEMRNDMGARARSLTETWTWNKSMATMRHEIYPKALSNFEKRFEQRLWKLITLQWLWRT